MTTEIYPQTPKKDLVSEKCNKVHRFQSKSLNLDLDDEQRHWLENFINSHIQLCRAMMKLDGENKNKYKTYNATQDFVKLESFKSYAIEVEGDGL